MFAVSLILELVFLDVFSQCGTGTDFIFFIFFLRAWLVRNLPFRGCDILPRRG